MHDSQVQWIQWIWVFPKIRVAQNGWFIMEKPIIMDEIGGKAHYFQETSIWASHHLCSSGKTEGYVPLEDEGVLGILEGGVTDGCLPPPTP